MGRLFVAGGKAPEARLCYLATGRRPLPEGSGELARLKAMRRHNDNGFDGAWRAWLDSIWIGRKHGNGSSNEGIQEFYRRTVGRAQAREDTGEPESGQRRRGDRRVSGVFGGGCGRGGGGSKEGVPDLAAHARAEAGGDFVSNGGTVGKAQGRVFSRHDARDGKGA